MFAQMILSDIPSVNSVGGVVVKNDKGTIQYLVVSGRLLAQHGMIRLKKGVQSTEGPVRLSEDQFTHDNPDTFLTAIKKMTKEFSLDIRINRTDLLDPV